MINYSGEMVDFSVEDNGARVVTIKLTFWKESIEMVLKRGQETERLERDAERFLAAIKAINGTGK